MITGFSLVRSTLLLVTEKTSIQKFSKVRCQVRGNNLKKRWTRSPQHDNSTAVPCSFLSPLADWDCFIFLDKSCGKTSRSERSAALWSNLQRSDLSSRGRRSSFDTPHLARKVRVVSTSENSCCLLCANKYEQRVSILRVKV